MATPRDLGRTDALPPQAPAVEQRERRSDAAIIAGLARGCDWCSALVPTDRAAAQVERANARPALAPVSVVKMPKRPILIVVETEHLSEFIALIRPSRFRVRDVPGVANRMAVVDVDSSGAA